MDLVTIARKEKLKALKALAILISETARLHGSLTLSEDEANSDETKIQCVQAVCKAGDMREFITPVFLCLQNDWEKSTEWAKEVLAL